MGLASLVLVAVPVIWLMSTIVTQHALQGVAEDSEQLARLTMAPVLTAPAVRGDRAAVARVDFVVRSRMSDGSVRRITVWDAGGKVVYADRAGLRGHRFRLPPEAAQRFAPGSHPAAVLAETGSAAGMPPRHPRRRGRRVRRSRGTPRRRSGPVTAWSSRRRSPRTR